MNRAARPVPVLHINDCAFTTTVLMREAGRRALPWEYLPLAVTEPSWRGATRVVRRALRGAGWEARLAGAARRADLLHIHFATVVRHAGWVPRPHVLHLHGTDARSYQYDRRLGPLVRRAIERADAVLYSTPDLAPHVDWRPDATLLPVPIDTTALPVWAPAERPRVVFASRWHEVKGLAVQLAVAELLSRRLGNDVELVGVDWGPGAGLARAAGVRLVPKADHATFQRLLATAHVVVGQPTGMLAASELEALGIGVPVVAPLHGPWYRASGAAIPPVLGGVDLGAAHALPPQDPTVPGARALERREERVLAEGIATAVLGALGEPGGVSARIDGAAWLAREHGSAAAVDALLPLYDRVMAEREA